MQISTQTPLRPEPSSTEESRLEARHLKKFYGSREVVKDVSLAVRKGEVVGAYRDEFEVKRLLKSDPTASLTLRTVTFKDLEDTLGIAVGIGDPVLLAFVNQFLAQRPDKLDIDKVLQAVTP